MKDFGTFCMNPFSDRTISLERKQLYGEDSIQRIAVQNKNNVFDGLLAQTIAAQENLFGSISNVITSKAIRTARTKSVTALVMKFRRRNTRLNSYFISLEIDNLPVYLEFFPHGVQAFTRSVTKENAAQRMEEMIDSITNNTETAGGAAVLTEYQEMLQSYKKARSEQLTKKGELSSGFTSQRVAEERWDEQMFSNLLFFANLCHNKPGNLLLYQNAALLKTKKHQATSHTGHVKGKITDFNGHPLCNAIVQVKGKRQSKAHSDTDGSYTTRPLPVGNWQLEYRKGKKRVLRNIEIVDGQTLMVDVAL